MTVAVIDGQLALDLGFARDPVVVHATTGADPLVDLGPEQPDPLLAGARLAPRCQCDSGPMRYVDQDGDPRCARCGRRAVA